MSAHPPPSPELLEQARAYLRVDRTVVESLPGLGEAIRTFQPVPGAAGESVARWLSERALREPQDARAAGSQGIGGEMLEHAAHSARLALEYVGATVLVVDPFDEHTDSYWREHWGLRPSEQPVPGKSGLKRLWVAIPR